MVFLKTVGRGTILAIVMLSTGCASIESDWEKAVKSNTIASYSRFLKKYPESDYSDVAREKRNEIYWRDAVTKDTIRKYERFIQWFPNDKHVREARRRISDIVRRDWEKTLAANTVDQYKQFMRKYPHPENVKLANAKIYALYKAKRAQNRGIPDPVIDKEWEHTTQINNFLSYTRFMRRFPESPHADTAEQKIRGLSTTYTLRQGEVPQGEVEEAFVKAAANFRSLERFVNDYPTHTMRKEWQQKLQDRFVDLVLYANVGKRFAIHELEHIVQPYNSPRDYGRVTVSDTGTPGVVQFHCELPKDYVPVRLPGGAHLPTGQHSIWRIKGNLYLAGFVFSGDRDNPLRFLLVDQQGLVYLYGKGRVIYDNGNVVTLPRILDDSMRADVSPRPQSVVSGPSAEPRARDSTTPSSFRPGTIEDYDALRRKPGEE